MIETTRFGALETEEDKVITFEKGLIGFPTLTRFIVLDHAPGSKIHWLQSIQRGDIAFPVVNPDEFVDGYLIEPPALLAELIGECEPQDLFLGALMTFMHSGASASLNLKAPIILNHLTRRGVQIVLDDPGAPIRFTLGG
jgi:flagellar assembly factor FliW